jgi:uncharacterized surface protein with fasciclin (FAS1) repeats
MKKTPGILIAPAILLLVAVTPPTMRAQRGNLTSADSFVRTANVAAHRTPAALPARPPALVRQGRQSTPQRRPDARHGAAPEQNRGIVESLRAAGHFTKLLALMETAGLTETLSRSTKDFTLFAPGDDVFALLPAVLLADLNSDPAKALSKGLPPQF